MSPEDYNFITSFLLDTTGLSLGENKEYLLEARLVPLAQSHGMNGIEDLVLALQSSIDPSLKKDVMEAMTTNESSFFRDRRPFDELKNNILPSLIAERQTTQRLRIWCSACSHGQEPYSIVMLIREHFPELANWNIQIVATDLCTKALDRAQGGIYSQFEVQRGLPVQLLMKHFDQCEQGWQIKSELGSGIQWKHLNLLEDFQHLGMFDIVFCRNVLIYFKPDTKKHILDRISRQMSSSGVLLLGAAETVLGISDNYSKMSECQSAIYQLAKTSPLSAGVN
ncbi:CheR family methyltransferase [Gimesia panareensis]|uniref:protein-glutamate O-methyltransferase n=1 Tax=Gimesia panareensis TaxID=2527978 RepID=A0A518A5V7_9PLAN|nr:protein-glutamate O-methyltransferase CheR [Gimesia panareensis]QDT27029.1 Chemotaxis protein methyltransferase Cher2 [Gimesia panareensis]QDU50126.1 Chemotaxis protein methyltransferase Cher2 [Gimesia panareensis]